MIEFRILGPLEAVGASGSIRLGGLKQRATLAILLLQANRVVSVERLADDLYAGAAPVTAVTQVQRNVSELRKALGPESGIETRSPGYMIQLAPEALDLNRFERSVSEAARELALGDPRGAAERLRAALAMWQGGALADLAYESFAQAAIARLEELRLTALELRIDADLALGLHAQCAGELEALEGEHPLRERFCAQRMVALYRSGRQADALATCRRLRERLVRDLGIEPTPALRGLERSILTQDPSLEPAGQILPDAVRGVLVACRDEGALDRLIEVVEPLARQSGGELIVVRVLAERHDLTTAAADLRARRASLATATRTAAFSTQDMAHDLVRLADALEVELVILDLPTGDLGDRLPADTAMLLDRSPTDIALLTGFDRQLAATGAVAVPFGGGVHDWAALELAARFACGAGTPLRLLGTAGPARDSSRLLAYASLAVQRVVGIDAEAVLVGPGEDELIAAVGDASIVVVGVSPRWRLEGIGSARHALVRGARSPVVVVHRGPRPSGLAPRESLTRFTWSLGD